ncbi:MAG: extracellular solute-binding protein [Ruminococcaceae bacterium]|nr:extracellular solute-binding protein [Oscillospiraceae bacterium]
MGKSKCTRFVSALLAALTVFGSASIVSFADDDKASSSISGAGNLSDVISAATYEQYSEKYANEKTGSSVISLDVLNYDKGLTNAEGVEVYSKDGTYENYKGGRDAIYLPATGTVGWKLTIPEGSEGKYTIRIVYYSETSKDSKKTSIERSFYLDGEIPFYESTYLSFTKTYVCDYKTVAEIEAWIAEQGGGIPTMNHTDKTGSYAFQPDINGNEIRPGSVLKPTWREAYFSDPTGYYVQPLEYYFSAGEHTIQLYSQRESMSVASIELVPYEPEMSYEEYVKYYEGKGAQIVNLESPIVYEAEFTEATSEATIYATNDRTSCITSPQDPALQALNTIGGGTDDKRWNIVGQWVRYKVEVPESGFYKIVMRYNQNTLEGSFVSRKLRVQLPGEEYASIPFYEASYLQFRYADDWQTGYIKNSNKEYADGFMVYLEKGENLLEFEANLGEISDIIRRVDESLDAVNAAYIKILMICGNTPDENTSYGFYRRIPEAVDELYNQSVILTQLIDELTALTEDVGSQITTLRTVATLLEKMGRDETEIAKNLATLKGYLGTLGTWINDSRESPLELDYFAIDSGDAVADDAPQATPNFWQTMVFEFKMFWASFTHDYDTLGQLSKTDSDSIEVWVSTARDQTQIIRNLVNNEFTPKSGIGVELKLVAGGSLLPSVLAGVGPDVSVGHGSGDVINWAIRSALVELTDFVMNDEDNMYNWFSEAAWIPLELDEVITVEQYDALDEAEKSKYQVYYEFTKAQYDALEEDDDKKLEIVANENGNYVVDDKGVINKNYMRKYSYWGVPTEQSFYMMFYRADVFAQLGIDPPETWDDLESVIGVLMSNHMEIAMPTSLEGLKLFLYQMGGDLYANGGQTININSNVALSAFENLCSYFQQYRFPISYAFSSRFRTGEIPLGIVGYTTYTELSVYATEIKGLWEFVEIPGMPVYDEEGKMVDIDNTSISGTSALIMLKDAVDVNENGEKTDDDKTDESWVFMKWFVSETTQSSYASELTAVLGTVSKHPTANIAALKSLPWTTSEMNNLEAQYESLAAVREYPGGYIISRYVNFSFLDVYNNNADPVDALLEYVVDINSELTRKRKEFGLATMEVSYSAS